MVAGEPTVPEVASSQRSKHGCLTSAKGLGRVKTSWREAGFGDPDDKAQVRWAMPGSLP